MGLTLRSGKTVQFLGKNIPKKTRTIKKRQLTASPSSPFSNSKKMKRNVSRNLLSEFNKVGTKNEEKKKTVKQKIYRDDNFGDNTPSDNNDVAGDIVSDADLDESDLEDDFFGYSTFENSQVLARQNSAVNNNDCQEVKNLEESSRDMDIPW